MVEIINQVMKVEEWEIYQEKERVSNILFAHAALLSQSAEKAIKMNGGASNKNAFKDWAKSLVKELTPLVPDENFLWISKQNG
jgi:hypothetical protein